MTESMAQMQNLIEFAKAGNEGAVVLLREIIKGSAEGASDNAIVQIAEAILQIGIDDFRRAAERN